MSKGDLFAAGAFGALLWYIDHQNQKATQEQLRLQLVSWRRSLLAANDQLEMAITARADAEQQREAAVAELDNAKRLRVRAEQARDAALAERDHTRQHLAKAEGDRDASIESRDQAVQALAKAESARDAAITECARMQERTDGGMRLVLLFHALSRL